MKELMNISSALANSDLFKSLQETNDKLAGGGGDYKRISIKGGKFRLMVAGEQVGKPRTDALDVVIIDAAELSKTYYEGAYDPDKTEAPHCWSSDNKTPDASVPEDQKMSDSCKNCPMSIKGSGQRDSAACRFSQRLAVVLESQLDEEEPPIYQISLPAKSLFGAAENGHMPMQAYGKMLKGHKAPAIAVVTSMYFDEDSETPKLFFKPNRMLGEDELTSVVALRDSDEVKEALTLSVAETSAAEQPAAKGETAKTKQATATKKTAPKKEEVVQEEDDEEEVIEEPVKVTKKKDKPEVEIDDDLAGLIDDWDE